MLEQQNDGRERRRKGGETERAGLGLGVWRGKEKIHEKLREKERGN